MIRLISRSIFRFNTFSQYDRKLKEINTKHKVTRNVAVKRFDSLDAFAIDEHSTFNAKMQLNAPMRWTPLIQMDNELSLQLKRNIKRFQNQKVFDLEDEDKLTDMFIQEAIYSTDYDILYNYECKQTEYNKFHGRIDYLIYQKHNELPVLPIIRTRKKKNPYTKQQMDDWNKYEATGVAIWTLNTLRAIDPSIKKQRVLQTNGHEWKMYEINVDNHFRNTGIYKSNKNEFHRLYDDDYQQRLVLGLIRFCLIRDEKQQYLEEIYSYIDEKMYAEEEDKQKKKDNIENNIKYPWIPKRIRQLLFS